MRKQKLFLFAIFCVFPALVFAAETADLVLVNGKIITVDQKDSIAPAIAIRDGKILMVGSNEEIRKFANKSTRLMDLHGLTVTPGLIDAHCHFDESETLYEVDLSEVKSISEVVNLIRQKASQMKKGEWILGRGWDESKLSDLRYITVHDLDPVTPENPVWLTHT